MIYDLKNEHKKHHYFIKIQDSFEGCFLSLCMNIKKNKKGQLKLWVISKENGLAGLDIGKDEVIDFLKRESSFDIMKRLI